MSVDIKRAPPKKTKQYIMWAAGIVGIVAVSIGVANLKPAKLMGIESQGMVLAAGDSEVRGLATFLEDVEPGTKVK